MSLATITERLRRAELNAGRAPGSVSLIAVSKVQPPERVAEVLEQGQRVFGENRVQEAQSRWPDFQARYQGIELHLIGPLQTNKARAAVEMFDAIHTLDRLKLAQVLALRPASLSAAAQISEEDGALVVRFSALPSPKRRRVAEGHEVACVLFPEVTE